MAWVHHSAFGMDGPGTLAVGQTYHGTAGNDTRNGTADDDTFKFGQGGTDTLDGRDGNDLFQMLAALDDTDRIHGGDGFDTVVLNGDYTGLHNFGAVFNGVEKIVLAGGFDYEFNLFGIALGNNETLTIDASALGANDAVTFFGTDAGLYDITGGDGADQIFAGPRDDVLRGGGGDDYLRGFRGADLLYGGGGRDNFDLGSADDSTGPDHDTIFGFDARRDTIGVNNDVARVDPEVDIGTLSLASFNSDMADWIGKHELGLGHAVLWTPEHGDLGGHTYLIVETNGKAGYQPNKDYVVELSGASHLGNLHEDDFTISA